MKEEACRKPGHHCAWTVSACGGEIVNSKTVEGYKEWKTSSLGKTSLLGQKVLDGKSSGEQATQLLPAPVVSLEHPVLAAAGAE